jgi:transposase-like protein
MINCPRCNSENIIKNGSIHNGKPKFMCTDCQRQFIENPTNLVVPLVDKLLLEKIPIAGISRVTGVSEPWLQKYILRTGIICAFHKPPLPAGEGWGGGSKT